MSKAVLMSIRPKWCELIASGKKTVEIRKTAPKLETPFKVYIYCTQDKRLLRKFDKGERIDDEHFFDEHVFVRQNTWIRGHLNPNKKVIGEFVCKRIDRIGKRGWNNNFDYCYLSLNAFGNDDIEVEITDIKKSCIPKPELNAYGASSNCLFAWHISDLVIYDHPKALNEFYKCGAETLEELSEREALCGYCSDTDYGEHANYGTPHGPVMCEGAYCDKAYQEYLDENFTLVRPPQSWCYVEEVRK